MTNEGDKALIVRPPTEMVSFGEVQAQATKLNEFYKNLMQKGTDYDVIPGTPKPTLLKPGAELLRLWTGIRVEVEVTAPREDWEKGIFAYVIKCRGYSPDGQVVGEGIGSCTSLEGKYRFRWVSDRELPVGLDKETLPKKWMKTKTGGSFPLFRIENDNAQDQANTILKMAKKRAFVDLMLTVTGASRIFTQDIEDMDIAPQETPEASAKPATKVTAPAIGKDEKTGEIKDVPGARIIVGDDEEVAEASRFDDLLIACPIHGDPWKLDKFNKLQHSHEGGWCKASPIFFEMFAKEAKRVGFVSEPDEKWKLDDYLKARFGGRTWSKMSPTEQVNACKLMEKMTPPVPIVDEASAPTVAVEEEPLVEIEPEEAPF